MGRDSRLDSPLKTASPAVLEAACDASESGSRVCTYVRSVRHLTSATTESRHSAPRTPGWRLFSPKS